MTEKQKMILIVDDHEDLRESLAVILEDEGFQIKQASQGVEALEILKSDQQIDLLITDVLMPEMDGIELAGLVKNEHPNLKIMLISGGGKQLHGGDKCDYLDMASTLTGIEHVLKKPFNPVEIISLAHKLLED